MMRTAMDFGSRMTAWAEGEPAVSGLVLIGSRERAPTDLLGQPDAQSDWDFHVISSRPEMFTRPDWTRRVAGTELLAYAARTAVIGGVPKVSAVFAETEADLVVIPERIFRCLKLRAALGLHHRAGPTRRRMQDIAEVIRPGWRFLKGEARWGSLYRKAVAEVADPHLDDAAVLVLAEGFVCDYVWTRRKLARGELRAALRMIQQELAEVNFRLLHELKGRRGERTFTKARRIERLATATELESVTVEARIEAAALAAALEKCAATSRELMHALVGDAWRWPDVR
jgi:hypothetical protein